MRHHFQDHRYGFGVSSPLWDAIMGTLPRSRKAASSEGEQSPSN
jgi:sterol desaturase/sphingolipid hydroxylase (fatty acid hydroxylase superfamily)